MKTSALWPAVALAMIAAGCAPKYPKCVRDEHCKPGEFCVNGLCQQCRTDGDCPHGQKCNKGRCEKATCTDDSACGPGMRCEAGKCVKAAQCQSDGDCPEGNECQQGRCVAPPKGEPVSKLPCTPDPVYFDFDEHILSTEATSTLKNQVAPCLKKLGQQKVRIEGHCDPRGTEEYNLALGDRRAQAVKRYLERLGVQAARLRAVSKGKLEASGTDQASWTRDRKVQFAWE